MNSSLSVENVKNSTYITELKKTPNSDRTQVSNLNKSKKGSPFRHKRLNSVSEVIQSINQKTKNDKKMNEEFLDFLINEKTNFADLDKVEKHYQNQIINQYKTFNENKTVIEKKEKEYNMVLNQMESALVSKLNFSKMNIDYHYERVISQIKASIRLKEHELECYKNTYRRLYKSNYLLKKRYEEEIKIQNLNDQQHEKYNIIKNHAILTITNQNNMLNNMKLYYEMATLTYANEINQKTKKFNELEFQVMMIKKDTKDIEEIIAQSKIKQRDIRKEIILINRLNEKLQNDYFSLFHDFVKIKMKLIEIYSQLNVKNLDDIILRFNQNLKKYQTLSSLFALANNDIVQLNNELTELNNERKKIQKKLETFENKINKDACDFAQKKQILSQIKELNLSMSKQLKGKHQKIILLLLYLVDYIIKMQESMKNCVINNFFNAPKIFGKNKKEKILLQYISIGKNKTFFIDYDKLKSIKFDPNFIQFLIYLFNSFSNYLFLILSSAYNYVFVDVLPGLNNQFEIFNFSKEKIKDSYEKNLQEAFVHSENKKKLLKRSEKEILYLQEKENQKKPSYTNSASSKLKATISDTDLYFTYINYIKNNSSNNQDRGIQNYASSLYFLNRPRQSILLMSKFANELVLSNNFSTKTMGTKREFSTRNKAHTRYIETPTTTASKTKKKIQEEIIINENEVLDESDKFDEENYNNYHKRNLTKGKNNRTKYGLSTKNPEMDKVYQRLNDLRKLELNYSKDINKSKKNFVMSPLALTEIYYNFKKRYMRSKKKNLYSNTDRSNKPDLPNLVTISSTSIPPKKRNKSTQENGKNRNSLNNTIPSKTTYLTSTNQPNTLSTTSKNFYTTKSVGMKSSYSQTVSTKL